jgi:hypothetical protein
MNPLHPHASKTLSEGKVGRAAFQAFLNISEQWRLKREQQLKLLGDISPSNYHLWKKKIDEKSDLKLNKDTLERISYVLGIYKALHILLPKESANLWIHKPNTAPLFNNQTALDRMLAGNVVDLADVRRYLDSERGV